MVPAYRKWDKTIRFDPHLLSVPNRSRLIHGKGLAYHNVATEWAWFEVSGLSTIVDSSRSVRLASSSREVAVLQNRCPVLFIFVLVLDSINTFFAALVRLVYGYFGKCFSVREAPQGVYAACDTGVVNLYGLIIDPPSAALFNEHMTHGTDSL